MNDLFSQSSWGIRKWPREPVLVISRHHKHWEMSIGFARPYCYPEWTWDNRSFTIENICWPHQKREKWSEQIASLNLLIFYVMLIKFPVSRSSPENSRPLGLLYSNNPNYGSPSFQEFPWTWLKFNQESLKHTSSSRVST